jgi:glutamate synthase domain-containing protein 2/glutamate synthase domain-containing protein 1/glutamate synthase domain-containing protein 3
MAAHQDPASGGAARDLIRRRRAAFADAARHGLYRPELERDACGVGFVANVKGERSHDIIDKALAVLDNLTHRGACGCDPLTGDGAGILLQVPHEFFVKESARLGFTLPAAGEYGVGMLFLPRDPARRRLWEGVVARIVAEEGQRLLGWRQVPVDESQSGWLARSVMPEIRQVFVGPGSAVRDRETLDRKLYVIRKRIEHAATEMGKPDDEIFYVCTLSTRTVGYKGLLISHQIPRFYRDLADPLMVSALALIHQRFSTNTMPSWERAHPYRFLAHNGEINTLRGNVNWMHAREKQFASPLFGADIAKLAPIIDPAGSDSAMFDNALELLVHTGRSLPHAVMMMIPEAWQKHEQMSDAKRAFYEYHACLMEPWDGPASIAFTDGTVIGAVLDRNGLRPSRYVVTKDGFVVMASEVGVLDVPPENVLYKDRLQPGRMFLVDTAQGRIVSDEEIKEGMAARRPYRAWLSANLVRLEDVPPAAAEGIPPAYDRRVLRARQQAHGYTMEDLRFLMTPMAINGQEAVGSMGNDAPLAVLSDRPQLLFNYFKQLFAQVTNPPIDSIREELVMSLKATIGSEQNLFDESPEHCHQLELDGPVFTNGELERIKRLAIGSLRTKTLDTTYRVADGGPGLRQALETLCTEASAAIAAGFTILVLSDREHDAERAPIPSLLATAAVHHHLIREGTRTRCGLVVESGEPREVQHFCLLVGYGAGAVNPYLAFETLGAMIADGILKDTDVDTAIANYVKAASKGILKVMTKMGISTLQSYRGGQIFEAVGLNRALIDRYFTWTASRIEGIGLDEIAEEVLRRHHHAYAVAAALDGELDPGGYYQWRRRGEYHMYNPETVAMLQHAARSGKYPLFKRYSALVHEESRRQCTIRGLLEFKKGNSIPIADVEPWTEIVKRFKTGAMSLGSISREAHETLAIAMNRIGGKSNTGEGGEDPVRYVPDANGDFRRSAIKQVASGRFGVTSFYLVNSDELQIKMAQGAKPGEGGQLPGHKVDEYIAKIRYATPGVGLISPPPHHDIYSIEDLAQLIHDLKNSNRHARVSVKLVAEVGVGTVAAGVAKAKADVVLISGYEGGTGASPLTSIKHAGVPWELGLAETQQVLVLNDLRGRIRVETDGQLKTGRDVAVACLLGAEEFGFASAALVAGGCIMMRVCHLNTCPVGIATQDPILRQRYEGKPEHVVNFMRFVAEELREIMAELGFRTVDEMVGRVDLLEPRAAVEHWKAKGIDLSQILYKPDAPPTVAMHCIEAQDHGLDKALDNVLIERARPALEHRAPVELSLPIRNVNRTVCTMLSAEVSRRWGAEGLPPETVKIHFTGSAGQSFCAFMANGLDVTLEGDANDYFGKGLSGGRVVIYPPKGATFAPEENIIVGNVSLYGATGGEVFLHGLAGERFCVRNSGVTAVVEGVGDHGCEYMTKGLVVVLGPVGRNFAAGMSGGIAYVLDVDGSFERHCNPGMVGLEALDENDLATVRGLVQRHYGYTESRLAWRVLSGWKTMRDKFVRVMPTDYRKVLAAQHLDTEAAKLASI